MKKLFFIAVIASVALAGCIKNDPAPSVNDQNEITFSTPVVGLTTKAEIEGTTFPAGVSFNVWAWYHVGDFVGSGEVYMDEVTVSNAKGDFDADDTGTDTWKPEKAYYWPKNGELTFEAYSPSTLETDVAGCSVASSVDGGIVISDFDVPTDASKHIDLLFSDRTYDREASSVNVDGGYDGVDIVFHHALSVVKVFVKASNDAAAADVRVKDVHITNAYHKGTLKVSPVKGEGNSPEWIPVDDRNNYDVVTADNYDGATEISTDFEQLGSNYILLPQVFATSGTKITVDYYINNGGGANIIEQTYTLDLASANHTDGTNQIAAWEMGKRYTYNITIGVEEIFIAPSIADNWTDVTVNVPGI